jgi:cytoskeletal protein RodZ
MDNQKPTMTRGQYRKQRKPFYKKAPFIITLVVILIAIVAGIWYWGAGNAHKKNAESNPDKIEKVQSNKSTKKKKSTSKSAASKTAAKDDSKSDDNNAESKKSISNPGSYNNLDYKSDDFEFKISNDVKLVKDTTGGSALLIKYTYTNKTDKNQIPQKIQSANMILKQNDKELVPTGGDGDYSATVSESNMNEVKPGASFDSALLVGVSDTNTDVNMYFMNIETHKYLDTMQPFKLS